MAQANHKNVWVWNAWVGENRKRAGKSASECSVMVEMSSGGSKLGTFAHGRGAAGGEAAGNLYSHNTRNWQLPVQKSVCRTQSNEGEYRKRAGK